MAGCCSRRGPHQRGLVAPLLVRVDVGAVTDQQLRGLDIAGARHNHQRRLAIGIGRFDIGAGRQQCAQQFRHRRGLPPPTSGVAP